MFPIAYLVYPVWGMASLYNEGNKEYELAQVLKAHNINGSFTGNISPRYMSRLAYFSGMQYYYPADKAATDSFLISQMIDYKVNVYFLFHQTLNNKHYNDAAPFNCNLKRALKNYPIFMDDSIRNVTIYDISRAALK